MKDKNIVWHHATVTRQRREKQHKHRSVVLWFTGLSGAGKSTLAHEVEERLHQMCCSTFVFDGDNVRHGLCKDLGFSIEDRKENLRRIAEMVKLFSEAGVICLTAFISPFRNDRREIKSMFPEGEFIEVYCSCSIDVCESRDVKGLYQSAREGRIKEFTGISSPYEEPENADIVVNTGEDSLEDCVNKIVDHLIDSQIIQEEHKLEIAAIK